MGLFQAEASRRRLDSNVRDRETHLEALAAGRTLGGRIESAAEQLLVKVEQPTIALADWRLLPIFPGTLGPSRRKELDGAQERGL